MPSLKIIFLPNVEFLYLHRHTQDTDLWQAGNWNRANIFQPLCQYLLSFVYQNWLELLTRIPKGRTEFANNHGYLHSISWSRQRLKHNRALTSRHTHLVLDSPWKRVKSAQTKTHPCSKMQTRGTPNALGQQLHNRFLKPVLPELLQCLFIQGTFL